MDNIVEDVLSILKYIIYRTDTKIHEKFLKKWHDYHIEYISPVRVTIIPKVLYVLTDNITDNRNSKILNLYISLLYNIHNMYHENAKIYTAEHNNMGTVETMVAKNEVTIIRGNTLTLSSDVDFEIWIYVDQVSDGDAVPKIQMDPNADIAGYRIIIAHSSKIRKMMNDNSSIKIYA